MAGLEAVEKGMTMDINTQNTAASGSRVTNTQQGQKVEGSEKEVKTTSTGTNSTDTVTISEDAIKLLEADNGGGKEPPTVDADNGGGKEPPLMEADNGGGKEPPNIDGDN